MQQPLLFGLSAEMITAISTLGSFVVVLIFSIIATIMQAHQASPAPVLMADLVERTSPTEAAYRITVCNVGKSPIQVSTIESEHDQPSIAVSKDGENFARRLGLRSDALMPQQMTTFPVHFRFSSAGTRHFYIYVEWHANGLAASSRTATLFVSA